MDMQHVKYLLAVSETLNFTRAAEACGVSQPTLTRAVKAIEVELGGDLLRREGRRTHVTELGERMLPFLRKSYENAILAKELARAVGRQEILRLSLAVSHCVNLELFMDAAAALYRQFPGLQLRITHGADQVVADALKDGRADLALASALEDWERFDSARLFDEPFCGFVAGDHELADLNILSPQALAGHPLFLNAGETSGPQIIDWLSETIPGYCGASEFDRTEAMTSFVTQVKGVVIAPASARLGTPFVKRVCDGLNVTRRVSAYTVAGRPRTIAASTFLNQLRATDYGVAAEAA